MKNIYNFLSAAILLVAATSLTGCQEQDFVQEEETPSTTTGIYTYQLSVGTDPATRSLRGGQPGADGKADPIESFWDKQTDQLIAYTYDSDKNRSTYDVLSAVQDGQHTSGFTGEIITTTTVSKGSPIFLFYPARVAVDENQENAKEVDRREYKSRVLYPLNTTSSSYGGIPNISLGGYYDNGYSSALIQESLGYKSNSYFKNQTNISGLVHLDISAQDGTIETIGKKFDFQYAEKRIEKVDQTNKTAQMGRVTMNHLMGMLGMRFATPEGSILQAKDIKGVYISNVKSLAVFDLTSGKFDTSARNDYTTNIMLDLRDYPTTTTNPKNYIYASLFPETYSNVRIIAVTKDNKCYEKTWKTLKIEAGNRILNNVLFTKEVKANQPYVEVAGVKWATGNFIIDVNERKGRIAPEQWTISKNYITEDNLGTIKTVHDAFDYTSLFVDHHAFNKDYKALDKDIVYKSMTNNNGSTYYRIPTLDEFINLITKGHIIPAYCLDDEGRKIYGIYCYDADLTTPLFRREVCYQELYKFNNVTGLTRANKGLFLPYSDLYKRNTTTAALGLYMSSQLSQKGRFESYYYFFFGYDYESNWMLTYDGNANQRNAAIRPVYIVDP